MAGVLLLITALLYFGTGVDFFIKDNISMAIVFASYAIANVGLYFAAA